MAVFVPLPGSHRELLHESRAAGPVDPSEQASVTVRIRPSQDPKALEKLLREDLEALVFVRIPQIPSSRAFGSFPISSFDEYMKRVPEDKAQWKIVPVDARPFPPDLIESDTLRPAQAPAWLPALYGSAVLVSLLLGGLLLRRCGRLSRSRTSSPPLPSSCSAAGTAPTRSGRSRSARL